MNIWGTKTVIDDKGNKTLVNRTFDEWKKANQSTIDLASASFKAISSFSSSWDLAKRYNEQININKKNIDRMKQNIWIITDNMNNAINQTQEQGVMVKGQQLEQMSVSGFKVSSAAYQNMLDNTDFQVARNVAALNREKEIQLSQQKHEIEMTELQNKLYAKERHKAKINAITGAISSFATSYMGGN